MDRQQEYVIKGSAIGGVPSKDGSSLRKGLLASRYGHVVGRPPADLLPTQRGPDHAGLGIIDAAGRLDARAWALGRSPGGGARAILEVVEKVVTREVSILT